MPTLLLTKTERIAFDTNAIIYLLEEIQPYHSWLQELFSSIETGQKHAVVSVLSEAETLIKPLRTNDRILLLKTQTFFAEGIVQVLDVSRRVATLAAQIRSTRRLHLIDSVIAATAIDARCDLVVGNDRDCARRLTDITYVYLEDAVRGR